MELYDYQRRDVHRLRQAFASGTRSVVYQLPTGGGKTVVAGHIASGLARNGRRALVLVHRRELVRQFCDTLGKAGLAGEFGVIAAGRAETPWARFQVASVQSLARRAARPAHKPDFVIVDEAHHAKARTWEKVMARYPDSRVLGLTATPGRLDGKPLGDHFDRLVQGPSIAELVALKRLAPMRVYYNPHAGMSAEGVRKTAGDYSRKELGEKVTDKVVADAAAAYRAYAAGLRAVFFGVNVPHSRSVAAALAAAGVRAEHVDARTDPRRRDRAMAELAEGSVRVVCNVDLISEGFDCPACDAVLMGRPTQSVTLYLQQAGRAMRYREGKTALLLDLAGNVQRLGLPDEKRSWDLAGKAQGETDGGRAAAGRRQKCCPSCACVFASRLDACPSCGEACVPARPIEVETELREARPGQAPSRRRRASRARLREEIARVMADARNPEHPLADPLEGLLGIAAERGYKDAWAYRMAEAIGVR